MAELDWIDLPRDTVAPTLARRVLADALGDRMNVSALDRAKLVATELVANAVQHGEGAIRLGTAVGDDLLRIEVADDGRTAAVTVREKGGPDGGWGLQIVENASERGGAYDGSTHVWADLRLD